MGLLPKRTITPKKKISEFEHAFKSYVSAYLRQNKTKNNHTNETRNLLCCQKKKII